MASLRSRVESALSSALAGITGANIYTGIDSDNKVLPCIICRAVSAEDVDPRGGRYIVTCEVITKDNAASDSTFDALCQSVSDILDASTLSASLTSATLFVYGLSASSRAEWGTSGDAWTETRQIQIECAPQP